MKKFGPELKMPKFGGGKMKMPPFFSDLYSDLRDRRLLPLVALVLVAIVATPILLSDSGEKAELLPPPSPIAGASSAPNSLSVVQAQPGLRNYKKRLARRKATNPFQQRFTAPVLSGEESRAVVSSPSTSTGESSASGSETSGGTPTYSPPDETAPGGTTGGGSTQGSSGSHGGNDHSGLPEGATIFSLEVTLQITRIETKPDGTVDKKGPTLYKEVQAPAPLPGEKTPVITYLGMSSKDRVPLFLVSNEVTQVFGEANCISGAASCQLLVLEKGFPVTFVYGDNDVRYKVNLINAEPVVTGHS
jgi:hypothetical protein